jgi:hypothetical protein
MKLQQICKHGLDLKSTVCKPCLEEAKASIEAMYGKDAEHGKGMNLPKPVRSKS